MRQVTTQLIILFAIALFFVQPVLAEDTLETYQQRKKEEKYAYLPGGIKRLVRNFKKLDLKYKDSNATLTSYGYNLYEDMNALTKTGVRIRSGISKISKSAAPGIEIVINW